MTKTESLLVQQLNDEATAKQAFSQLVSLYQVKIYHTIRRMLIDHEDTNDAVQLTFIKAWQKRAQFNERASFFTWLYRIGTNEALQHLRKKRQQMSTVDYSEVLLSHCAAEGELSADEVQLKLEKALLQLPDKQRLVFQLKYFDELKYEEIATITSTSVGALKASYHHAVKKIENYINHHD
ncbi:MAG: RNA polymerase sigma factor (sigma-70 family) [Marivirga sp.]|jgi:RNA polymerase sigma factor (sigma-70 family)